MVKLMKHRDKFLVKYNYRNMKLLNLKTVYLKTQLQPAAHLQMKNKTKTQVQVVLFDCVHSVIIGVECSRVFSPKFH